MSRDGCFKRGGLEPPYKLCPKMNEYLIKVGTILHPDVPSLPFPFRIKAGHCVTVRKYIKNWKGYTSAKVIVLI